jgi:hypothetical protein
MLEWLLALVILFLVIIIIVFFQNLETSSINEQVRKSNSCEPKNVIKLNDSKTGIQYKIVITADSCEDGMPHTINEDTIMMPESYPEHRVAVTIEHEKIHLLQRRYPIIWESWYEKLWRYTIYADPPAEFPHDLIKRRRINPDIENKPYARWIDKEGTGWWSLAVFRSEFPSSLKDAETVWWNEKTGEQRQTPPPEWITFFGGASGAPAQDEHPHEMAAQMIANSTGNKNRILELVKVYEYHFVKNRTSE